MSDLQPRATKIAAAGSGDVSVELWSAATGLLDLLSLAAGNAHLVVALHARAMLGTALDFIAAHRNQTKAEWLEIGVFASCPVNLYTNRDGVSLICDGPTIAGYSKSFAIRFGGSRLDWLCGALGDILVQIE